MNTTPDNRYSRRIFKIPVILTWQYTQANFGKWMLEETQLGVNTEA